jgi:hypothetical protein
VCVPAAATAAADTVRILSILLERAPRGRRGR